MALVRLLQWGSVTKAYLDEAFTYAGGTLATIHAESGTFYDSFVNGWLFYVGAGTTGNNICAVALGGSNDKFFVGVKADDSGLAIIGAASYSSTNIRIVATKKSVAITNVDANGCSKMGVVFTTDNNGDLCCVTVGGDSATLANPAIVPRDPLYLTKVQYQATTSTDFGCTALSYIPVPSYDGSSKYLPYVAFAHATQYVVDASVTINDDSKFYSIGGSWFLDDNTV